MERRNSPTPLNYIASANQGLDFDAAQIKGIQIRQPFESSGMKNTILLSLPMTGFRDARLSFAAVDEGAAQTVTVDYQTQPDGDWFPISSSPLTPAYAVHEFDFSGSEAANNNPAFAVRIRFTGPNMQADEGNRVTLNNIALHATPISLETVTAGDPRFLVYPNPTSGILHLSRIEPSPYAIFGSDGRRVGGGLTSETLDIQHLQRGIYFLHIHTSNGTSIKKIAKR